MITTIIFVIILALVFEIFNNLEWKTKYERLEKDYAILEKDYVILKQKYNDLEKEAEERKCFGSVH